MKQLLFILFFFSISQAGLSRLKYDSQQLAMKDFDEMSKLIDEQLQNLKIKKVTFKESSEDLNADRQRLKDVLMIVLSAKERGSTRGPFFNTIMAEAENLAFADALIAQVVDEALAEITDSSISLAHRATYVEILNNLLAEIKSGKEYRGQVEKISAAKIRIPKDLAQFRKLQWMTDSVSPSERASSLLKR